MTIREVLEKKRGVAVALAFLCWLSFAGGIVFTGSHSKEFPLLIFIPFIGFGVCVLFLLFGLRCPKCKNNLGYTLQSSFWRISKKLKFCPFCGVSLDTEIEAR
jgi:hypothetical protein